MSLDWQDRAACRGMGYKPFFGAENERQPEKGIRERKAKAICAGCGVQPECLEYVLASGIRFGVWGGAGEDDRNDRRKRLRLLQDGSAA